MSVLLGIALALVSALATAGAHLIWKVSGDRLAIRVVVAWTCALICLPLALAQGFPTRELAGWLILSGVAHAIYQLALAKAYSELDFSLAFPLARGVAPLATTVLGMLLLGDRISPVAVLGIGVVSSAIFLMAFDRRASAAGLAAAGLAGLLITLYTLVDAQGVRLAETAMTFVLWFFPFEAMVVSFSVFTIRRRRFIPAVRSVGKDGAVAGLLSLVGFGAFLLSLDLVSAGVASGLRETSVLFAALLAVIVLKETISTRRKAGVALGLLGASLIVAGSI